MNGTDASAAPFEAIGAIGELDDEGHFHPYCTGTLIDDDVVLTAKHCIIHAPQPPLFFALGWDADAPRELIELERSETASPHRGGVAQLGSDIGVYVLSRSVADVQSFPISRTSASPDLVGTELLSFGYGADPSPCSAGSARRRVGAEVIAALRGNVLELIYGSRESYLKSGQQAQDRLSAEERYQTAALLEQYEVWVEPGMADAQSCFGDSGGPVMIRQAGRLEIFGVNSWSFRSAARPCDHGAVVAIFGPEAMLFVDTALRGPAARDAARASTSTRQGLSGRSPKRVLVPRTRPSSEE